MTKRPRISRGDLIVLVADEYNTILSDKTLSSYLPEYLDQILFLNLAAYLTDVSWPRRAALAWQSR